MSTKKGIEESKKWANELRAERVGLVEFTDKYFFDLKTELMTGAL